MNALTEFEVDAEHAQLHQDPHTILEVKKILYEHLIDQGLLNPDKGLVIPTTYKFWPTP